MQIENSKTITMSKNARRWPLCFFKFAYKRNLDARKTALNPKKRGDKTTRYYPFKCLVFSAVKWIYNL
jgi:hypothetical protein